MPTASLVVIELLIIKNKGGETLKSLAPLSTLIANKCPACYPCILFILLYRLPVNKPKLCGVQDILYSFWAEPNGVYPPLLCPYLEAMLK